MSNNYSSTINNDPIMIGSDINQLNINTFNLYSILYSKHKELLSTANTSNQNIILLNENILNIQKSYLELIKTDDLILYNVKIKFSEDFWDFSSHFKEGKHISEYRYYFSRPKSKQSISKYYIILLKLFTFYNLTEHGISNLPHSKFLDVCNFFSYLTNYNINTIEDVSVSTIEKYFDEKSILYATKVKQKRKIKSFFEFYSLLANDIYTQAMSEYFSDINTNIIKATIIQNKTPLLPTKFYNDFKDLVFETAYNQSLDKETRALSGLVYIGTQTGLRESELTILKENCIEEFHFNGKKAGKLHYRITKNSTKNEVYNHAQTNASEQVIDIVNMLKNLYYEERKNINTDLLCFPLIRLTSKKENSKLNTYRTAFAGDQINNFIKMLCTKNYVKLNTLNREDSDMFTSKISYKSIKTLGKSIQNVTNLKQNDIISVPGVIQFRVYVASDYRERGVDDRTIAYLLGHDSYEMWGYYVRPKHEIQEDIDFSREIVTDIVKDNIKILGPKGEALEKKIDQIIKDGNLNVETDLNSIIEKVFGQVPIRAKEGGFCIKSNPRRECRHDSKSDEFLCAYGCCPNHCHMYFMVPVTYRKYNEIVQLIKYNQDNGYINQSEKEMYKLESIIFQELKPELDELDKELNRKTETEICSKYHELQLIINNKEKIKEDINIWIKKIKLLKESLKQ